MPDSSIPAGVPVARTIDEALNTAGEPLSVELLHQWHERLMQHGRLPARTAAAPHLCPGTLLRLRCP